MFTRITTLLSLFCLLTLVGCLNQRQDPATIFKSTTMPKVIEKLANPQVDLKTVEEKILASSETSETSETSGTSVNNHKNTFLDVAVIDNGVDYLHPELISRVHFNFQDGNLISAGKDFLGNDNFAYPSIVDASIFAFGAEKIENGAIVGPLEDPVALLLFLNDEFMKRLEDAIQSSPVLNKSLLRKINVSSFNIFGLKSLYPLLFEGDIATPGTNKDKMREELLKNYSEAKRDGKLVTKDLRNNPEYKLLQAGVFRKILDQPWLMSYDGSPYASVYSVGSSYSRSHDLFDEMQIKFEDADIFLPLLEKTYADFNRDFQFEEKLKTYVQYRHPQTKSSSNIATPLTIDSYSDTYYTLARIIWSEKSKYAFDVLDSTLEEYCTDVSDREYALLNSSEYGIEQKTEIAKSKFDSYFEQVKKIYTFAKSSPDFSIETKESFEREFERITPYKNLLNQFINARGYDLFFCKSKNSLGSYDLLNDFTKDYQRYNKLTQNPYVNSSKNKEQVHGTHVAGIISKQDNNIGIVPVRVLTESQEASELADNNISARFLAEFRNWFTDLTVQRASCDLLKDLIKNLEVNPCSESAGNASAEKLFKLFEPIFKKKFSDSRIDYHFFYQLNDALKYVGEQKIKLANISLGTSFSRGISSPNNDTRKNLDKLFDFLVFEFFKFQTNKTIKQYAPNTLFVVAAGNDGAWLDGRNRSALPCDLSTPFLDKYIGSPTTNNNVLCVGSIGPEQELSSFTNIPLTQIPFVFSFGEAILSTIKTTNCSGNNSDFNAKFALNQNGLLSNFGSNKSFLENYLTKEGIITPNQSAKEKFELLDKFSVYFNTIFEIVKSSQHAITQHSCITSPKNHDRLSGTSMASPAVAGYLAKMVLAKAKAFAIEDMSTLYNHPEFTPAKIIQMLMENAPAYGGSSIVREVRKVTDIGMYDENIKLLKRLPGNRYSIKVLK
ncbi:MAG: S8 family serine peptidase [Oligoflexia bacterium]|nr:S8 family serine peptidase [Oligoflexia bacterium]